MTEEEKNKIAEEAANVESKEGNKENASDNAKATGKMGWNPVQSGKTVTHGTTETKTNINVDTTGYDKPTEYNFRAPERDKFVYDPAGGILGVLKPPKPEWDAEREDRLNKLAKVNALGDFAKHLAAFAGNGYAPVEKRTENKQVIRAFQELDKLRDVYDARKKEHSDRMFDLGIQDYAEQKGRADENYNRKYAEEKERAGREFQVKENIRQNLEKAHYEKNTTRTTTQDGETDQFKNLNLTMAEFEAKKKGSGKDENFYGYLRGVGDLKISKDAQIQIGTRIVDAMLNTKRIDKKAAGGMLAALNGPNSRNAFQSTLGYLRYVDVYNACKQFIGHGMEILNPEKEGYPLDNVDDDLTTGKNMLQGAYDNAVEEVNKTNTAPSGYDYSKMK